MSRDTGGQATGRAEDDSLEGVGDHAVRVLIADNHDEVLQATSDLVTEFAGTEVVSLARSVEETVRLAEELKPDLVLIDAWLKGGGAAAAYSKIRAVAPQTAVAVVTSVKEAELAKRLSGDGGLGCFEKELLGASLPGILASVRSL
jgi:two-component system, NarL family, invasion response regulator UvrY